MKIIDTFKTIIHSTSIVQSFVAKQERDGVELDRRLDVISKATLDGEEQWFLDLLKRDPDCAIRVIKECDLNDPESVK